jgi:hypothetical protein
MLEVMVFGERRIYQKDRRLLLPLIDKEIQGCLDGIQPAHPISALASMVRFRYEGEVNSEDLKHLRIRIANDLFFFSFAAFSNFLTGAAWVLY